MNNTTGSDSLSYVRQSSEIGVEFTPLHMTVRIMDSYFGEIDHFRHAR